MASLGDYNLLIMSWAGETSIHSFSASDDDELLASIFEERAENLSKTELDEWTAEAPRDKQILAKLQGPGAKLLIGPRGSGKSTLLRRAYFHLLDTGDHLTAYVNYARSLALEPMFHRNANALQLFRQWVLFKIVLGVREAVGERPDIPENLLTLSSAAESYIRGLEKGTLTDPPRVLLAPSELLILLESWTKQLRMRRCVLLMDDAAHAFSTEQQREFFEIFRELRSRLVSGKAAVYPGITSYSPHFNVGHEGELVEAWFRPDDADYLPIMRRIVQKRLPQLLLDRIQGREELVDYLALASFGIPRGFLVMLSQLLGVEEDTSARPSRQGATEAVASHVNSVWDIYTALKAKLPRFRNFIGIGEELVSRGVNLVSAWNREKPLGRKAVILAIAEPITPELQRVLAFLEYAGIMRRVETVSRGREGVYQRYMLHYALLLHENALGLGRSFSLADANLALQKRDAHAFVRTRAASLLGSHYKDRCTLDLAPCQYCGTPRLSEDAQFCMKCGKPLADASVYEELIKAPIDALPLTRNKLERLKKFTSIKTVQDILIDDELKALRSVPYVGPVWAGRIRGYAEEFVSV